MTVPDAITGKTASRRSLLACGAIVVVHALLLFRAALWNSVTFDEYAHLPAGIAYWSYGELSVYSHSPPLLRAWGALPVILAGATAPPVTALSGESPFFYHWTYGDAFERANQREFQRLFLYGRCAMILLSCLALIVTFRWAKQLYGDAAGLGACALYALCPNIAAHGSVVGTDVGTTAVLLLSAWLWYRFCQRPSWRALLAAGIAVGLAHLCKFTALLIWPTMAAMTIAFLIRAPRPRWRELVVGCVLTAAMALIIINLGYLVGANLWRITRHLPSSTVGQRERIVEEAGRGPWGMLGSFHFQSAAMQSLQRRLPRWTPLPLPRVYVRGFDLQKRESEYSFPAFLNGKLYHGSSWAYYPLALSWKLPLATIALGLLALVSLLPKTPLRVAPRWMEMPVALGLLAFALGIVALANVNIGIRYLLPMFPLAFILISRQWADGKTRRRWTLALLGLLAIENLSAAPDYLGFFNIAAGGTRAGYTKLNDSNFDWGQSLGALKVWMDDQHVARVKLAYFGRANPQTYGIDFSGPVPLDQTRADYFVVSSYFALGLQHQMRLPTGLSEGMALPYWRELRAKKPVAIVGDTLLVYRWDDYQAAIAEHARPSITSRPSGGQD